MARITFIVLTGVALGCLGCSTTAPRSGAASKAKKLQDIVVDKVSTDEEARQAFARLLETPVAENPHRWVALVNDRTVSDDRRALGFEAFFQRFVRPPIPLKTLVQNFGVREWFDGYALDDMGGTSWSPVHGRQWERRGIYLLHLPGAKGNDSPGAVWIALSRKVELEELLKMIQGNSVPGDLVIVRLHAGG